MTPRELLQMLQAMHRRAQDPTPILEEIGNLMAASVDRNFSSEGRPSWTELMPSTVRKKAKAGKSRKLMWSGNLARSITFGATANPSALTIADGAVILGTNVRYARIQNEGGYIQRTSGSLRFRTDAKGNLLNQSQVGIGPKTKGASNLRVFASKSHKRAVEHAFTHGPFAIGIPARPFLVFQPGEPEQYGDLMWTWIETGRIDAV